MVSCYLFDDWLFLYYRFRIICRIVPFPEVLKIDNCLIWHIINFFAGTCGYDVQKVYTLKSCCCYFKYLRSDMKKLCMNLGKLSVTLLDFWNIYVLRLLFFKLVSILTAHATEKYTIVVSIFLTDEKSETNTKCNKCILANLFLIIRDINLVEHQ